MRRWIAPLMAGAVVLMVLLLQPAALWATGGSERWTLNDRQGQRWVVSLFPQPDPAYPAGARLRVTALSPAAQAVQTPSHSAPLELSDAFAGSWKFPNRSEELVPPESGGIPSGSAQFGLDPLSSPPKAEGPVVLHIPLTGGERATVVLGPAPTAALSQLLSQG